MCSPYSHINLFTMNTELLNSVHIKKRIAINIPYHSISLQFYEYWSKLLLLRILQSCGIILFSKALNRCRGRESSFDRSMEIERISEINSNEGSTYTSHKKNIWHLTMEFRSFFEVLFIDLFSRNNLQRKVSSKITPKELYTNYFEAKSHLVLLIKSKIESYLIYDHKTILTEWASENRIYLSLNRMDIKVNLFICEPIGTVNADPMYCVQLVVLWK